MSALLDLVGKRFGRLIVLRRAENSKWRGGARWVCRCNCGAQTVVRSRDLVRKNRNTRSCGCLNIELLRARFFKHGASVGNKTPEYRTWRHMNHRCNNRTSTDYNRYGGRGIKVCERWKSFENFLSDMGLRPSPQHSIDRIDNDGDYTPENCRWATRNQQNNNKRNNIRLTLNGVTMSVAEASPILGIRASTLWARLSYGWSEERATKEPVRRK